jgi:hypothetical protein
MAFRHPQLLDHIFSHPHSLFSPNIQLNNIFRYQKSCYGITPKLRKHFCAIMSTSVNACSLLEMICRCDFSHGFSIAHISGKELSFKTATLYTFNVLFIHSGRDISHTELHLWGFLHTLAVPPFHWPSGRLL